MGNSTSSTSAGAGSTSSSSSSSSSSHSHTLSHSLSFRRSTGSLGLSKSELDRRSKASGLYPTCSWDDRTIRRLIGDGKLAARTRGSDSRIGKGDVECPICFLHYDQINVTKCCSAYICTECFLQMQPPATKKPEGSGSKKCKTTTAGSCCPFCNAVKLIVYVPSKDANLTKIAEREEDEQKVIEAKIRASLARDKKDPTASINDAPSSDDDVATESTCSGSATAFGSSLNMHTTTTLRKLSEDADAYGEMPTTEMPLLASVEERKQLEEEMKRQHLHPLARRMQQEAEEARNAHAAAAASRSNSRRNRLTRQLRETGRAGLLSSRLGRERDWNQLVESFETDSGDVQSIDDLVVIEAAILLSMEEAARQAQQENSSGGGTSARDLDSTENVRSTFPLLHALMARNREDSDEDDGEEDEGGLSLNNPSRVSSLNSSSPLSPPRRGSRRRPRISRSFARDTAGLIMRGLSEEEQLAMAIAMSLRESEQQQQTQDGNGDAQAATDAATDAGADTGNGASGAVNESEVTFPDILGENVGASGAADSPNNGADSDGGTETEEGNSSSNAPGAATSEE